MSCCKISLVGRKDVTLLRGPPTCKQTIRWISLLTLTVYRLRNIDSRLVYMSFFPCVQYCGKGSHTHRLAATHLNILQFPYGIFFFECVFYPIFCYLGRLTTCCHFMASTHRRNKDSHMSTQHKLVRRKFI